MRKLYITNKYRLPLRINRYQIPMGGMDMNTGFMNQLGSGWVQDYLVQQQQNNMQCPVGQQPGRGPDGRPTCVPSNQAGMPGASPARTPGAGMPVRGPKKPYNEGY